MTDLEIHRRLAGEFALRCVEPCSSCGGKGQYNERVLVDCGKCNGTGLAFRTDVKGRELIREATTAWYVERQPDDEMLNSCNEFSKTLPTGPERSYADYPWKYRQGQPWQAGLESFVRDYEAEPPDLMANDGAELKRLLDDRIWSITHDIPPKTGRFIYRAMIHDNYAGECYECEASDEAASLRAAVEKMIGDDNAGNI